MLFVNLIAFCQFLLNFLILPGFGFTIFITETLCSVNISADSVVYAGESGAETSTETDKTGVLNSSQINTLNSQIRNIQAKANGAITISDNVKEVKEDQLPDITSKLNTLSSLIDQYNTARKAIETQNHSTEGTVGVAGQLETVDVTGSNLDETITNLQNLLTKMQSTITANQKAVDTDANTANQNRALIDKIKEANQTISGTASTIKNYKDGISGDLDAIKRKSQDSIASR